MPTTETGVCNVALSRIGHTAFLTDLDSDTTAEARACQKVFDLARDTALGAFWWYFARGSADLTVDEDLEVDDWGYVYLLPADFLVARYLFNGVRNPAVDQRQPYELAALTIAKTSAVAGLVRVATTVTATTATQHDLAVGDVVTLSPGETNFAAGAKTVVTVPTSTTFTYTAAGSAVSSSAAQTWTRYGVPVLATDIEDANLVYTRLVDDVLRWPAQFQSALAWALAVELALSVAKKPSLAGEMQAAFTASLKQAEVSHLGQRQADVAGDSEFITVRGS